jgi:hypothetical protein
MLEQTKCDGRVFFSNLLNGVAVAPKRSTLGTGVHQNVRQVGKARRAGLAIR